MTVGLDGNLYISSQNSLSIVEYNLTTQSLSTFPPARPRSDRKQQWRYGFRAGQVTFGPDGDLYVAERRQRLLVGSAVVRFDINNNGGLAYSGQSAIIASAATLNVPGGLIDPTGMAFGVGDQHRYALCERFRGRGRGDSARHRPTPGTMTTFVAAGSMGHTLNYPSV